MHVQAALGLHLHWKTPQEFDLPRVETPPGPVDDATRVLLHRPARFLGHGQVMVSEHGDGASLDPLPDDIDDRSGVRAVADMIAEERELLRSMAPGMRHARRERFEVGEHVGQKRDAHGGKSGMKGRSRSSYRGGRIPAAFPHRSGGRKP